MPRIGMPELLLILLIVILIFGVGKLPEVGAALGRSIREFREATSEKEASETKEEEEKKDQEGSSE